MIAGWNRSPPGSRFPTKRRDTVAISVPTDAKLFLGFRFGYMRTVFFSESSKTRFFPAPGGYEIRLAGADSLKPKRGVRV
jgi:hypothetical protein